MLYMCQCYLQRLSEPQERQRDRIEYVGEKSDMLCQSYMDTCVGETPFSARLYYVEAVTSLLFSFTLGLL